MPKNDASFAMLPLLATFQHNYTIFIIENDIIFMIT
jgi:hypothetical protein